MVQLLYPPPFPPSIPVTSHCFWVLWTKLNALHILRNCCTTELYIQPGFWLNLRLFSLMVHLTWTVWIWGSLKVLFNPPRHLLPHFTRNTFYEKHRNTNVWLWVSTTDLKCADVSYSFPRNLNAQFWVTTSLKGLDEWLKELSSFRFLIAYNGSRGIFISLVLFCVIEKLLGKSLQAKTEHSP